MAAGGRPLQRLQGSCHCGAVRFAITTDFPELTTCDCSLCKRRNALMVKVHESAFELLAGAEQLATYQWHTHTAVHHFCKLCGIPVPPQAGDAGPLRHQRALPARLRPHRHPGARHRRRRHALTHHRSP